MATNQTPPDGTELRRRAEKKLLTVADRGPCILVAITDITERAGDLAKIARRAGPPG